MVKSVKIANRIRHNTIISMYRRLLLLRMLTCDKNRWFSNLPIVNVVWKHLICVKQN